MNASTRKVFSLRHRLEKKDPKADVSEAVEPIIYYLDNGTPEPVRSALLSGGLGGIKLLKLRAIETLFKLKCSLMMPIPWMCATM